MYDIKIYVIPVYDIYSNDNIIIYTINLSILLIDLEDITMNNYPTNIGMSLY